jgi:hypothetical protein
MSYHQNAGRNYNLMICNKVFENVAKFKYIGAAIRNQHWINEDIKSRLKFRESWQPFSSECLLLSYHGSHLLSENLNITRVDPKVSGLAA